MKSKYKFPQNFLWGSATSAPQTEANGPDTRDGKSENIWEKTFSDFSDRFFNKKFSSNNFYEKFKEDIKIAKNLNFNSLRTSISWSRLIPDGKNINKKAVDFYNKVFNEFKKHKIKIFICLFHFDMPMWAQKKGGWLSLDVVNAFAFYAMTALKLFGKLVDRWISFNEPIVLVEGQYWCDFHYPFSINFTNGIMAMLNINKAHCLALKEFKKLKLQNSTFGIILNITPAIPRSNNLADLHAAKLAELFQWRCFSEPAINGQVPNELIKFLKSKNLWPKNIDISSYNNVFSKNKIDFLGVNYYQPIRVKSIDYVPNFNEDEAAITPHSHFYQLYDMPGKRMNIYRGWEIYPKAIYSILNTIKNEYNNIPCYVAENGMGVENEERFKHKNVIQDTYRIAFLNEHLYWIHKAISNGCNCFGYHMWTYIDNWSWLNAYKNRYGFIELNLKDNSRHEKLSASWIRKVIKNNCIEY